MIAGEPKERLYAKKPTMVPRFASPGQVFDVQFTAEETVFVSGPKGPSFVGLSPDDFERARWQLRDRAAGAMLDQQKAIKKGDDTIAKLATPLRRLYAVSTPFERSALLVRIVAEVMKEPGRSQTSRPTVATDHAVHVRCGTNHPAAACPIDQLPPAQERKGCDRDDALMAMFPARSRIVRGWLHWPHTRPEIAAIRLFLESGDLNALPLVYRPHVIVACRCGGTKAGPRGMHSLPYAAGLHCFECGQAVRPKEVRTEHM